jgi:hypothetical protein
MNGLSTDTDLTFLNGRMLTGVRIGGCDFTLSFDDDVSIYGTADMGHRSADGELTALYKMPIPAALMLCGFLYQSVVRSSVEAPGTLVLEFSNRQILEIYDSNSHHESYNITARHGTIVV